MLLFARKFVMMIPIFAVLFFLAKNHSIYPSFGFAGVSTLSSRVRHQVILSGDVGDSLHSDVRSMLRLSRDQHELSIVNNKSAPLDPFLIRIAQLCEYRNIHGDVNVPRRYKKNPSLGNWVNKMRQQYRKYLANETHCTLTPSRIETLNRVGFVWDARHLQARQSSHNREEGEMFWERFDELSAFIQNRMTTTYNETTGCYEDGELTISPETVALKAFSEISCKSELGVWLSQQRKEYSKWTENRTSVLTQTKVDALNSLDKNWAMSPRQRSFELNFMLLVAYKKKHGDTLIPISYRSKKLAHWVNRQRRNYNWKMAGEKSDLTDERMEKLQEVGFVWDRWDFEFEKKGVRF